ncbi:MAG TPA: S8 family serine peptidase, partial [Bradyrhizobium sp.]|nr:S8 family serine peptidase [Bradyrhizobium sp.]
PDSAAADQWARSYIAEHVYEGAKRADQPFITAARPSNEVRSSVEGLTETPRPHEVVVALNVYGSGKISSHQVVNDIITAAAAPEKQDIFSGSSPDLVFASSDHWCIGDASDSIFSDRSGAEQLLGVDYLRSQNKTTGKGVNVVIVDQGLDRHALGASYGGGWAVGNSPPGSPLPTPGSVRRPHGMMIAHNVLKVAPDALLFDLPLAPPRIANIQAFLSLADAAYQRLLIDIADLKLGQFPGPWILVNPWGIYDRESEHPKGHYTENPKNHFNRLVVAAVSENIDVVFAAGNCGQFCPDNRCGATDQGPGRSIWGANSLKEVLTVGAVRADDMWLGYSSQGPGQLRLGPKKPDLCAASQFCENDDAFSINTGTSAACGLTAGIVAALRSRWNSTRVSPDQLKDILNQTARRPPGLSWGNALGYRLGNGILDASAAFKELKHQFP